MELLPPLLLPGILVLALAYPISCILVGWAAARKGYWGLPLGAFAFVATPLLGFLLVIALPPTPAAEHEHEIQRRVLRR